MAGDEILGVKITHEDVPQLQHRAFYSAIVCLQNPKSCKIKVSVKCAAISFAAAEDAWHDMNYASVAQTRRHKTCDVTVS